MTVKIDIDTRTFVRFWLVLLGFGVAGLAIYSARTALILVLVSFFLALALNSPVHYLAKFMPGKSRLAGTAAAFVAVVVVLIGVVFLVVPPMVQQSIQFTENVPNLIEQNRDRLDSIGLLIEEYHLESQINNALESAQDKAGEWASSLGENIIGGVGSLASAIISTIVVLVMSFLMLLEGPQWMRRLWSTYIDETKRKHHQKLAKRMYAVVTGFVNGQIAVASIAGAAAGLVVGMLSLFIQELPGSLALPVAAIAGILSLVPMFGATIAGILITIMLALNSFPAAIAFLVYFVVYQQVENNFVSPVIQAKTIQLSALVVLVAVTIGTFTLGLIGGLISIPIAGWIKVLLEDYLETRKQNAAKPKRKTPGKLLSKLRSSETKKA